MTHESHCPDCTQPGFSPVTRRQFVTTVSAAAVASALPKFAYANKTAGSSEQLAKKLYASLTDAQKEEICFEWDYTDDRGLLRTFVNNNWQITDDSLNVGGDFFTADQRDIIESIFWDLYNPDWKDRIKKQLKDDAGGYGKHQTIAMFGTPDSGKFEFVMTGRHLTIRCDGDSAEHVAFGGPIFYGHAAQGFDEKPNHPGNIFWPQAAKANGLFQMLDGKQRKAALIAQAPSERTVQFRGKAEEIPGIPVSELTADQKQHAQEVLQLLLEPYRVSDRDEVVRCLDQHGGLDQCRLAFYQSGDIGNDGVWDIWRLEGPSFVWHFRGTPHVHVWVNVASDPSVRLNTSS